MYSDRTIILGEADRAMSEEDLGGTFSWKARVRKSRGHEQRLKIDQPIENCPASGLDGGPQSITQTTASHLRGQCTFSRKLKWHR